MKARMIRVENDLKIRVRGSVVYRNQSTSQGSCGYEPGR